MELGYFGINLDLCGARPDVMIRTAVAAEAAGWESVWTGEHYVLPDPRTPSSPAPPETPMLDPFVALGAVAARTTTLRLGTGVTVVPLHQPLALAKRVASVDVLSGGRVLFGIGVGYLREEFDALGAPFEDRGRRTDEALAAMHAIWAGPAGGVRAEPAPVQRPGPPVHVGGHVPASFRRAVAHGAGWYGFALDHDATAACVAGLQRAAAEVERPEALGPLEVSVTPNPRTALDAASVARFAELGVDRLILLPPRAGRTDPDALVRFVEDVPASLR